MGLFKQSQKPDREQFAFDELNAVRKRLDRLQSELDHALELSRLSANVASTALGEVARQNEEQFKELARRNEERHQEVMGFLKEKLGD